MIAPKERLDLCFGLGKNLFDENYNGDPYLSLLYWYAIEPTCITAPRSSVDSLYGVHSAVVREFLARRLVEHDCNDLLPELIGWLQVYAKSPGSSDVLRGILTGLDGQRHVRMPADWPKAYAGLSANSDEETRERALQLAVKFDDQIAVETLKNILQDSKAATAKRLKALQLLAQRQSSDLLPILHLLLDAPGIRGAAIRSLAVFDALDTPDRILNRYAALSDSEKPDAIQTLISRPSYAAALLDAVEKGTVPRKDISPVAARQILSLKNPQLAERLAKVWGTIRPASKQRAELTAEKKQEMARLANALKAGNGDFKAGKEVFTNTCAKCHKLFGEGASIGPELTGSQRGNLDYILENVLDPSAVVPREYQVIVFELKNGRVLNGIVAAETERAVTVQTQNDKVVVAKDDIESRTQTNVSMMPEGLFDALSPQEVRNLVAYLMGPGRK